MAKANDAAVVVFTAETREKILHAGGSGGWVLSPKSLERCQYLVCCRRVSWENKSEGVPPRAAFLVGRIAGVRKLEGSANERGQERFHIGISEHAKVDVLNVWRKELRNPVAYDSLRHLGIEPRRLKFQAVPEPVRGAGGQGSLTIAQAKKGLAETFGVKPDDIEIIIKG